jgi:hypothetical protein
MFKNIFKIEYKYLVLYLTNGMTGRFEFKTKRKIKSLFDIEAIEDMYKKEYKEEIIIINFIRLE